MLLYVLILDKYFVPVSLPLDMQKFLTLIQVIGTTIALHLLNPRITLIAGCVISLSDTLFILLLYKPDGSIRRLRVCEMFISVFVVAIFIMFCIELSFITAPASEVFTGLLPSKTIFVGQGQVLPPTVCLLLI